MATTNDNGLDLAAREREIRKDYRRVTPGSIQKETAGAHAGKLTVEITCAKRACDATRRVATSDLHQVDKCEDCTRAERAKRRREARQSKAGKRKVKRTRKAKAEPEAAAATA